MKVGFICQPFDDCGLPVPNGSIALLTWELARRLNRSHQTVVCAPRLAQQRAQEQWEGVQFNRFSLALDRRLLDRPRRLNGPLCESRKDAHSILYCALYALRSASRLRAEGCDIIHIHNFSQFVPIARLLNRKAKIVLHMNCDWLAQFDCHLIDRRLRHTDAIIGCAEYITNHVRARFPHHANRCVTIYNGANIAEFSNRPGLAAKQGYGKRFIFVGRVSPEKGIHVLLEGFKTVLAQHPDAELKILGGLHIPPLSFIVDQSDDPTVQSLRGFYTSNYMDYLLSKAKAMPNNQVSFTGFVAHGELAHYLHRADVFVQPSLWGEPFPLSVVEAMAAGLPVVSSRAGGLPESVVDGKTGLLVEPNNPRTLANAMLRLIANKEMAHSMGTAGAARATELFSWEAVVARLSSLYQTLTSGLPIRSLSFISTERSSMVSDQASMGGQLPVADCHSAE
jgi:glycosyltransferase involved in cell wall biosynthesis